MTTAQPEPVDKDKRFEFGENWSRFLSKLDDQRIYEAAESLKKMLEVDNFNGKSFLDVGSGSGLFSLAARRMGAEVTSFDFDRRSVACTAELKRRYFAADPCWRVEIGSVLDTEYLVKLGKFDIVYSWGVLHHTGALWQAIENVDLSVASGGKLFLGLYNDHGRASKMWLTIKRLYVSLPGLIRWLVVIPCFLGLWGPPMIRDLLVGRPFATWREYGKKRGMSAFHDLVDWVGGYPFEVSTPKQVFDFYKQRGYRLTMLNTCAGAHGCNEYVFQKES